MSIRAFSAQRFYALATGVPFDRSRAVISLDTKIPDAGILQIEPDPQGESELLWTHSVVASADRRMRFIDDIREGRIPTPYSASDGDIAGVRTRYHSLESLHAREQTLASLLGLTEPLIAATKSSRSARCPGCGHQLPLFQNSRELCDHLVQAYGGREIRIELIGGAEEISSWALAKGFTPTSPSRERASARIDSLTCSREALHTVETTLDSARRIPHSWISINYGDERQEFSWNGRCTRCDLTLAPFNASATRDAIENPTSSTPSHERYRYIDEMPLIDFLSLPLERVLASSVCKPFFNSLQRDVVQGLSLEHLTLHTRTTDLAPHILAAVALLELSRDTTCGREIRLFTAPASLFGADALASAHAHIEKLSKNSPFVWITEAATERSVMPTSPSTSGTARSVSTVTLNSEPPLRADAFLGRWTTITAPAPLRNLRVAARLYDALSGTSQSLDTVESNVPFTPYFVPLFPLESSRVRLIAHALGAIDPLAKMFAASQQAKMLGLTARDLLLGQLRQTSTVCSSCKGVGVLMSKAGTSTTVEPCHSCWGARFRSPTKEITFKGRTLWEILNAPLSTVRDTLRALPKMKDVVELASLLTLEDLPLGVPVALLSTPQRRLVAIAHAMISGTKTRPSLVVVEEPSVGFSAQQLRGLESAIAHPVFADRVGWIGVQGLPPSHS